MASIVVIVTPAPDNILVVTRGVTLRRRAALVSAAGTNVGGLVTRSLFAAPGLSAILQQTLRLLEVKYAEAASYRTRLRIALQEQH